MTLKNVQSVHGAEELAGVGLFFQQSPQHGVFVASVTPGYAGARTDCIKKGDVVIQVQLESVAGFSLAQLRQLVLGPPAASVS
jgi:C-terminal processing protease CtpA/Prc